MRAKIFKTNKCDYILVDSTKEVYEEGYVIGTSRESDAFRLSIKNCQMIERGYDLEELVEEIYPENNIKSRYDLNSHLSERIGFRAGFKKCLEILGDKRFSEKELTMLFAYGHQIGMNSVLAIQSQHSPQPMPKPDSDRLRDEFIQSVQKKEWDVEVEMEEVAIGDKYTPEPKPKLDEDGCLILRPIKK